MTDFESKVWSRFLKTHNLTACTEQQRAAADRFMLERYRPPWWRCGAMPVTSGAWPPGPG